MFDYKQVKSKKAKGKKEEVAEEQRHKGTKNMEKVPVIPKRNTHYAIQLKKSVFIPVNPVKKFIFFIFHLTANTLASKICIKQHS